MDTKDCRTPLLAVLRQLGNDDRRKEFADLANTKVNYLYQLASCKRASCSAAKALAISAASVAMSAQYGSDLLTVGQIATMCSISE